jgi:hypothetical protein
MTTILVEWRGAAEGVYTLDARNVDCDLKGVRMSQEPSPGVPPGEDALSGAPEPWEGWESSLVLGSLAVGLIGLMLLGWLVSRFILP